MRITVFTPTYNRAYILGKLYETLQRQDFDDFEWMVVDDCSTDNTKELFAKWSKEKNKFKINYVGQEKNGGKHRAINRGVSEAKGELFFIVDSDDYLRSDALSQIDKLERTIINKEKFAGVAFCRCYQNGELIGSTFSCKKEYLDATALERGKYKMKGDKAEVYYTDILKRFPFPEFEGENFMSEAVVWNKIAYEGYKLRWSRECIYYCEYISDGLTAKIRNHRVKSINGFLYYCRMNAKWAKGLKQKSKFVTGHIVYAMHGKKKKFVKGYFFLSLLCFPVAYMIYMSDKREQKKASIK